MDYAHGYLIKGTRFHTIMAYGSSNNPDRIPYFSNTLGNWNVKYGDENNDVRRKLIEER